MEASSPLAAMQAPSHPGAFGHGCRSDLDASVFLRPRAWDSKNFNFRDMSMGKLAQPTHQSYPDYFSWKPMRGSSPTASLAADLSQNFHIDKSPQLPTPRRSLFTTAAATSSSSSSLFNRLAPRDLVTPPIPSSSPGPESDGMDVSPLLPHKIPRPAVQIEVCSPTPEPTPPSDVHPQSAIEMGSAPWDAFRRRRPSLSTRPSVRRGHSTTSVSLDSTAVPAAKQPFRFGGASSIAPLSLLETFAESPEQDRKLPVSLSSSSLLASCRSKSEQHVQQQQSSTGSPVNHFRRATGPPTRAPRVGMSRRSQSMYASNGVGASRPESKRFCTAAALRSILDVVDESANPRLPHFRPANEPDALPRITKETLLDVLSGVHGDEAASAAIIDCRFEYEYEGGHIDGAVNYNDKELLARTLFEPPTPKHKILIFHCEYSAHRAPLMAKFIRQRDRTVNDFQYPKLTYPEIYILDGGYSTFFKAHSTRCFPQNYVEMGAKEHETACERGMAKVRQRRKLSRAQTYAFGQALPASRTDDSLPTQAGATVDILEAMDVDSASRPTFPTPRRLPSY